MAIFALLSFLGIDIHHEGHEEHEGFRRVRFAHRLVSEYLAQRAQRIFFVLVAVNSLRSNFTSPGSTFGQSKLDFESHVSRFLET